MNKIIPFTDMAAIAVEVLSKSPLKRRSQAGQRSTPALVALGRLKGPKGRRAAKLSALKGEEIARRATMAGW